MIILALDTTTRGGSVAVLRDGDVVYEAAGDPAVTHAQRLPADLMRALEAAGSRIEDVELFAVAVGPGSFTGLRVGIATVQGLAAARQRRVVPVSVLDALACHVSTDTLPVAAWVDAQRGQVFAALYDSDGRSQLARPTALTPEETLAAWRHLARPGGIQFVGDGAVRYAADIARAAAAAPRIVPPPLLAGPLGRMAAAAPQTAVPPHAVVPLYVRRPDAELARARQPTK
jgi:tRNA threonylcarbamoyladenosine biosynthesis protein TsaB